jgi:predicted transcriptional regulator
MNLNIYLEDTLAKQLTEQAAEREESRNALIREAIREWLERHQSKKWSHAIRAFRAVPEMPPFEDYRSELKEPKEDPFS